jgi:23S rRNA pseudouridine955/2504/2580 synthase
LSWCTGSIATPRHPGVAKKRSALLELQALMREGEDEESANKRYLALLVGKMPQGTMTVEAPLLRLTGQGRRPQRARGSEGQAFGEPFQVLERRSGHSFCEVIIETGRTHQIRVHAQHIGHPVAGDDKYGDREANKRLASRRG